jgi:hypothetical protein
LRILNFDALHDPRTKNKIFTTEDTGLHRVIRIHFFSSADLAAGFADFGFAATFCPGIWASSAGTVRRTLSKDRYLASTSEAL